MGFAIATNGEMIESDRSMSKKRSMYHLITSGMLSMRTVLAVGAQSIIATS